METSLAVGFIQMNSPFVDTLRILLGSLSILLLRDISLNS